MYVHIMAGIFLRPPTPSCTFYSDLWRFAGPRKRVREGRIHITYTTQCSTDTTRTLRAITCLYLIYYMGRRLRSPPSFLRSEIFCSAIWRQNIVRETRERTRGTFPLLTSVHEEEARRRCNNEFQSATSYCFATSSFYTISARERERRMEKK